MHQFSGVRQSCGCCRRHSRLAPTRLLYEPRNILKESMFIPSLDTAWFIVSHISWMMRFMPCLGFYCGAMLKDTMPYGSTALDPTTCNFATIPSFLVWFGG